MSDLAIENDLTIEKFVIDNKEMWGVYHELQGVFIGTSNRDKAELIMRYLNAYEAVILAETDDGVFIRARRDKP